MFPSMELSALASREIAFGFMRTLGAFSPDVSCNVTKPDWFGPVESYIVT